MSRVAFPTSDLQDTIWDGPGEEVSPGADQFAWGHGNWETYLLPCDIVDEVKRDPGAKECREICVLAQHFFMFITQCLPCRPCREFFLFNVLKAPDFAQDDLCVRTWLYGLRVIIDTKVKACTGKTMSKSLDESSSVFALLKRSDVAGVLITNQGILRQFMIMALRNENLEVAGMEPRAVQTRNYALFMAMATLATLCHKRRKSFSTILAKELASLEGEEWKATDLLDLCVRVSRQLEDPPFEDSDHARHALSPAFKTLLEWSKEQGHCKSCIM